MKIMNLYLEVVMEFTLGTQRANTLLKIYFVLAAPGRSSIQNCQALSFGVWWLIVKKDWRENWDQHSGKCSKNPRKVQRYPHANGLNENENNMEDRKV